MFKGIVLFVLVVGFIVTCSNRQNEAYETAKKNEEINKIASMTPEQKAAYEKELKEKELQAAEESEKASAKYACYEMVMNQMHDRESADLERFTKYYIEKTKNKSYMVQVTGRAKNGFGAMRKIVVNCTVKKDGPNWRAINIKQINI